MPLYFFETQLVISGAYSEIVLENATVGLYDPSDITLANPLELVDPGGVPLPNPLTASPEGFLPAFQAEIPQVMWSGGGSRGYLNSFQGVLAAALAAQQAAEDATAGGGGLPSGGTNGQVLSKVAGFPAWVDQAAPLNAGDVDALISDIVDSGTGAAVGSLDQRYRRNVAIPVSDLPAGSTVVVRKTGTTWPARPTTRSDIVVIWVGANPDPSIITSGTGGALSNVDIRMAF